MPPFTTSPPPAPADKHRYAPLTPSPLNPNTYSDKDSFEPRQTAATKRPSPRPSPPNFSSRYASPDHESPTQRLLRQKAALAWHRSETLRHHHQPPTIPFLNPSQASSLERVIPSRYYHRHPLYQPGYASQQGMVGVQHTLRRPLRHHPREKPHQSPRQYQWTLPSPYADEPNPWRYGTEENDIGLLVLEVGDDDADDEEEGGGDGSIKRATAGVGEARYGRVGLGIGLGVGMGVGMEQGMPMPGQVRFPVPVPVGVPVPVSVSVAGVAPSLSGGDGRIGIRAEGAGSGVGVSVGVRRGGGVSGGGGLTARRLLVAVTLIIGLGAVHGLVSAFGAGQR